MDLSHRLTPKVKGSEKLRIPVILPQVMNTLNQPQEVCSEPGHPDELPLKEESVSGSGVKTLLAMSQWSTGERMLQTETIELSLVSFVLFPLY